MKNFKLRQSSKIFSNFYSSYQKQEKIYAMPKKTNRKRKKVNVLKESENDYSSLNDDNASDIEQQPKAVFPKQTYSPMKWPWHYNTHGRFNQYRENKCQPQNNMVFPSAGTYCCK